MERERSTIERTKSVAIYIARAAMVQEAPYRIIRVSSISLLGSRCCMDPFIGTGSSIGTVTRQESVPNGSMQHRELLKWHC